VERSLKGANLWEDVKQPMNRPGAGMSGGQQQRLCIARAIAVQPSVLLMDEPCSALDPISTLAIEELISELKPTYTILIVTHNMQQAARVSDRTAFFNLAGVRQPGPAHRIRRHRQDPLQPDREGHRGLHLGPLRITTPRTANTLGSPGLAPHPTGVPLRADPGRCARSIGRLLSLIARPRRR